MNPIADDKKTARGHGGLKKIYLDVCTLCRPYDDQSYSRIRLESAAVHLILKAVETRYYKMIYSPVHLAEISAIPDELEKFDLLLFLERMAVNPEVDNSIARRSAEGYFRYGFGIADAAHLAFAELAQADFISCDDKLIKKCSNLNLGIWTGNPIAFCDKEDLR